MVQEQELLSPSPSLLLFSVDLVEVFVRSTPICFSFVSVAMSREDAKRLSAGMESGITWRQVGIKHRTTNEILIDIIESLDAIVDSKGMIVTAEVSGVVGDVCSNIHHAYLNSSLCL